MEYSEKDLKWLKYIAERKFALNWRCCKCGYDEYFEGRTPLSRKCLKCKHEESVTANTVFHGLKVPISKAISILAILLSDYDNFFYHVAAHELKENLVKSERRLEEKERGNRFERGTLRSEGIKFHTDTTTIAKRLGMRQKTVWSVIDRIVDRMENTYPEEHVSPLWFKGVNKENRQKYCTLFYLFRESRRYREDGDTQEIEDVVNLLLIETNSYPNAPQPHMTLGDTGVPF